MSESLLMLSLRGKIKAIMQAAVCFFIAILTIGYSFGYIAVETLRKSSLIAVGIAAVYSIFTLVEYFYANRHYIKKIVKN